jgi:hypothetical protein
VLLHPVTPKAEAPARTKEPALISPPMDVLMIGGASLVMFAFAYLFVDKSASTSQISWAAFYLAMLVNNPHFMASYVLLYWDKRKELFTNKRFLWAAVIAPTLTIGYMVGCVLMESPKYLSYAVNFMFFTVGWHYIKQIYGTIVVTNARRGYYFSKGESWALKANLYPVWFMSFINGNGSIREVLHYGVGYHTFALPNWVKYANFGLVGVSVAALFAVLFRKWVREGKLPGWPAIVSFAAIYCWYLPTLYHAVFWYMIPFFHSLQYMLFVVAMKKNQFGEEAKTASPEPAGQRLAFAKTFLGFMVLITLMAAATFRWIPMYLDEHVFYDEQLFGRQLFMFLFITFINIHHYFIDNVIWRRDNPALKKYLL